MSKFDHSTNKRVTAHYYNEISLWKNTLSQNQAEEVFWFWIAELLSFCFDLVGEMNASDLSDCMGDISRKIIDVFPCCGIESAVKNSSSEYKKYKSVFGVTDFFEECGEFYKELNDSDNECLKEQIVLIMSDYIKCVAPFVFKEAKKWMSEYRDEVITEEGHSIIERRFKYYLDNYKNIIKRLKK